MPGVVSLLPEPFSTRIEDLWEAMQRDFGIPKGYSGAIPHITFHIGANDVAAGAEAVVESVANATSPFSISTAGLGVFGVSRPVLHLIVPAHRQSRHSRNTSNGSSLLLGSLQPIRTSRRKSGSPTSP